MAQRVAPRLSASSKIKEDTRKKTETLFVQFVALRLDPAWRRLPDDERAIGRGQLAAELQREIPGLKTYIYSGLGLKSDVDLLIWRNATSPDLLQEAASRLLNTGLGRYLEMNTSLLGLIRPSEYVRRPTTQEQAIFSEERGRYLVVYPFSKTAEWYLLKPEERQELMAEHIRVGHRFPAVRQLLAYSFGLDDQEFIVAYEMEELAEFEGLVRALRETEVRRYTLRDTPIITAIHHPLEKALQLLG